MATTTLVGKTLGQRYEILSEIDEGGMGSVYEARHKFLDTRLAIKVLPLYSDEILRERFKNEALRAMTCKHDNVVGMYDYVEGKNGVHFLVMEYVPGEDLKTFVENSHGIVPLNQIHEIIKQVCDGLAEIHRHAIVHRDLKPENIQIQKTDEGILRAVIIDFGISKKEMDLALTDPGTQIGTYAYMSPEQIEGKEDITIRSDIYSLGVLFYQLMTGSHPFDESSTQGYMTAHLTRQPPALRKRRRDLPRGFQKVMNKALAKGAEDRFESVESFWKELAEVFHPSRPPLFKRWVVWQACLFLFLLVFGYTGRDFLLEKAGYEKVEGSEYREYKEVADSLFVLRNYEAALRNYQQAKDLESTSEPYIEQQIWLTRMILSSIQGQKEVTNLADTLIDRAMNHVSESKYFEAAQSCADWMRMAPVSESLHEKMLEAESLIRTNDWKAAIDILREVNANATISTEVRRNTVLCVAYLQTASFFEGFIIRAVE